MALLLKTGMNRDEARFVTESFVIAESEPPLARGLPRTPSVLKISQRLARLLWASMLWLMRRPLMKKLQRSFTTVLPKPLRGHGLHMMKRQNAFARKYGLVWLTCVIAFCLVTVGTTWTYQAAVYAVDSGILRPPARLVENIDGQN
jgi:hypothetical protein